MKVRINSKRSKSVGTWLNSASAVMAELLASSGFDFVLVDAEHSPVGIAEVLPLFQAIRSGCSSCRAWVRVPGPDYHEIKRYADAGADGILCPLVSTAEQAREVVRAVKYPPEGDRGLGFCRDNGYGERVLEMVGHANQQKRVAVQIEHVDGVAAVDEILAVSGVDIAFIGPYDLSASMGRAGDFDHPDYRAARDQVLAACRRHNVIPGIHIVQPDPAQALAAIRGGYQFIAYSLDITMVQYMAREGLRAIRSGGGGVDHKNC